MFLSYKNFRIRLLWSNIFKTSALAYQIRCISCCSLHHVDVVQSSVVISSSCNFYGTKSMIKLPRSSFDRTSCTLAYQVRYISCCCLHHVFVVQSSIVVISSDVKLRVAFSRVFFIKIAAVDFLQDKRCFGLPSRLHQLLLSPSCCCCSK